MKRTRILVRGHYTDPYHYELREASGDIFQVITAYDPFAIGGGRDWIPEVENGMMVCRKYGTHDQLLEEFPLPEGKLGLWALTSGAARRGVFHKYVRPKNNFERDLDKLGVSLKRLHYVNEIKQDILVTKYGDFITDGDVTYGEWRLGDQRWNTVTGGTYLVGIEHPYYMNGLSDLSIVEEIYITPAADKAEVVRRLIAAGV